MNMICQWTELSGEYLNMDDNIQALWSRVCIASRCGCCFFCSQFLDLALFLTTALLSCHYVFHLSMLSNVTRSRADRVRALLYTMNNKMRLVLL